MNTSTYTRRPIRARQTSWAQYIAKYIAKTRLQPNHISLLSIVFAAAAGSALLMSHSQNLTLNSLWFFAAAIFIILRLLCNLFDGMLAIEYGLASPVGELYNDLPDRPADVIILVAAGYATATSFGITLGWLGSTLALMTAYIRILGTTMKQTVFLGPMAKPHRMAVIISACLLSILEDHFYHTRYALLLGLGVIVLGCLYTIYRRLTVIHAQLTSIH